MTRFNQGYKFNQIQTVAEPIFGEEVKGFLAFGLCTLAAVTLLFI